MAAWITEIRGRVPARTTLLLGVLPIIAVIGLWYWCTSGASVEDRLVGPSILPSPAEVLSKLPDLATREEEGHNALLHHILASLQRVGCGFAIGASFALLVGIAAGSFGAIRAMVSPLMTVAGYVPIAALVPLTMSWFGIGEAQKVLFLAMAFAIFLLPQVLKAMDGVDDVYLRTARTLGARNHQLVFRVLLPVAAPDLWHSLRLAFGVGWTYIVLTEAMVLTDGMGYLIAIAQRRGPREQIYLVILIITLIAWLADLAMVKLGNRLFPYRAVEKS